MPSEKVSAAVVSRDQEKDLVGFFFFFFFFFSSAVADGICVLQM